MDDRSQMLMLQLGEWKGKKELRLGGPASSLMFKWEISRQVGGCQGSMSNTAQHTAAHRSIGGQEIALWGKRAALAIDGRFRSLDSRAGSTKG